MRNLEVSVKVVCELNDLQVEMLHLLYQQEWWTKGRTLDETHGVVQGSQLCVALLDDNDVLQGFARVLTDYVFKAMIFDLIVAGSHRGQGLGKLLLDAIKTHPDLQSVRHFELYCLPEMFPFYEAHDFSSSVDGVSLMRWQAK